MAHHHRTGPHAHSGWAPAHRSLLPAVHLQVMGITYPGLKTVDVFSKNFKLFPKILGTSPIHKSVASLSQEAICWIIPYYF